MAMVLDNPNFTQSTDRGPSPGLWGANPAAGLTGFPSISAMIDNPTLGWYIWDDFTDMTFTTPTAEANFGRYKAFGSSGATALKDNTGVIADRRGGTLMLTEATNDESITIQSFSLPFQIISTGGIVGFEARIRTSSIADTAHNTLIGLADQRSLSVGDPLTTAGALIATLGFVGFQRVEADGDAMDATFQKSGQTQNVHVADAVTLVADTWIKVGFRYSPMDGRLRWFVNGVENTTNVSSTLCDGATFPSTVLLGPIFSHMAALTSPGTDSIDWWKVIQCPADNAG